MTINELRAFLLCCLIINYVILIVWFTVFVFAHEWVYRVHTRWFKLSPESFDTANYIAMAIYKIGVLLFVLVPLIATWMV